MMILRKHMNNPFKKLHNLCQDDLIDVHSLILDQIEGNCPLILKVTHYIIESGGKRLRPILTLITASLCKYQGKQHIYLAACIELIHTATLLHDDVIDESNIRRNRSSVNSLWGNSVSILVGDFLFSKSFLLILDLKSIDIFKLFLETTVSITEGEIFQLTQLIEPTDSFVDYLYVIERKTACLFATACRVSCLITSINYKIVNSLENYGYNLGLAFQMTDDLLDYYSSESILGKSIGDDFREGKITLPCILAFRESSDKEKLFWKRSILNKTIQIRDLNKAIEIIEKYKVPAKSLKLINMYIDKAKYSLKCIPNSKIKDYLLDLAVYCGTRIF